MNIANLGRKFCILSHPRHTPHHPPRTHRVTLRAPRPPREGGVHTRPQPWTQRHGANVSTPPLPPPPTSTLPAARCPPPPHYPPFAALHHLAVS